jgi:hypothetical protein
VNNPLKAMGRATIKADAHAPGDWPEPAWLRTVSNHAVLTRDEVLQWLQVSAPQLPHLVAHQGFPLPRFTSRQNRGRRFTSSRR